MAEFEHLLLTNTGNIIATTETWLKPDNVLSSLENVGTHMIYRCDRANSGGGGVMLCVPVGVSHRLVNRVATTEFEAVTVRFDKLRLNISCIYKTPSVRQFADTVRWIKQVSNCAVDTIVLGDFNAPNVVWQETRVKPGFPNEQMLLNGLCAAGLSQIVRDATRGDSTLDLVCTSNQQLIKQCQVSVGFSTSDHASVNVQLALDVQESGQRPASTFHCWAKANYRAIEDELFSFNWEQAFALCTNVQQHYDTFVDVIQYLAEKYVPYVTKSTNYNGKRRKTGKIRAAEKEKDRMYAWYKRTKAPLAKIKLVESTKQLARIVRAQRASEERNLLKIGSLRAFWAGVRNRTKSKATIPELLSGNGTWARTAAEKANLLSEQYKSVFVCSSSQWTSNGNRPNCPSISEHEVYKVLARSPVKLAAGIDNIPSLFLRKCAMALARPLTTIFRLSIMEGRCPSQFKQSLVTPIPKKQGSNDPGDYRPVSITSAPSRALEALIRRKLLKHLNDNDLITKRQHGFMKNRSTASQLLYCVNRWAGAISGGKPVDVIYFDFKKAFDTVDHGLLLKKMINYRCPEYLCEWVKDYLTDRWQRVKVEGELSEQVRVTSGVPQGSTIGPLLFLIFINDLAMKPMLNELVLFADDIKLFGCATNRRDRARLQMDIDTVMEWSKANRLQLAESKCMVLRLGKRNNKYVYNIGGEKLPDTTTIKDLGVWVDDRLSFASHMRMKIKEANVVARNIKLNFSSRNRDIMIRLFKTFVRPKLEYCDVVWSPSAAGLSMDIERVQRRFTKRETK
jgi:hypothetical protein